MLLDDGFGKVMQRNVKVRQSLSPSPLQSLVGCFLSVCILCLQARGCDFFGLEAYPDIPSHESRFLQHNWTTCGAVDMATVYHSLPAKDRHRYSTITIFIACHVVLYLLLV